MNINALRSMQSVYSTPVAQVKRAKSSTVQARSDTVTISAEAQKMSQSSGKLNLNEIMNNFMDGAGKDGGISLEEMLEYGKKYQKKAEQVLDETLKELGIPSNQKITISTDHEGHIKVSADLPEGKVKKLEQALNDHPDFQQHYAKAAMGYEGYTAGMRHVEFARLYDKDPKAAVARFDLSNKSINFVLEYLSGESKMVET